ncbi:MAG TPA: glycosyltransferase family 4 protein [Alphaproteobacteria bacterium]|nr:glycosyltransferase family 4 protein [Alphaproteobacteria bacterium]USO05253.1 MAG: glycosyltransferase family 4 protein [Rhodospirillales bacterium]HOO81942.1 glycosyltransferase family 4 protein [Alphaproteobacteria bacterium]
MNAFQIQPVIMQIIPELGPGGAEQGCIDIAAELVASGAQAIIVSNGGSRVHELERIGAVHINLPVHSKSPLVMWHNITALRKIIERYNVNIVHVRSRAPAWSAYYACKKTSAHYITTCHAPYNISGEAKKFYNSSIAQGERVIAISNYVADYLRKNYNLDNRTIRLIPRGIPMERFHPTAVTPQRMIALAQSWRVPDGANIVMLPGRITRWKGHSVLINALERIQREDLFCVIIGSDQGRKEYRKELDEQIAAKGLEGRVRIVDHCNDMPAAYMLSTVVVCPSTDPEGFGRVPVEAQAMGRPVVASDHGGAQETILRGQTGWLVEPSNPQALAAAIEDALALTPTQRSMLATRAMTHIAANFTKEQMADKTLDVYAELLRGEIAPSSGEYPFHSQQKSYAQTGL